MENTKNLSRDPKENEGSAHYWESYEASTHLTFHLKSLFSQNYSINEQEEYIQLKRKADKGDVGAQFRVGLCFEVGEYVSKSYKKAFHYYKLAGNNHKE